MTPKQQRVLELRNQGLSIAQITETLGINERSVTRLLARARKEGDKIDPAIAQSMEAVGTEMVPTLAWLKTKSEEGTSYSVLLKPAQASPVDLAERVREALDGLSAAPPVSPPAHIESDLLTLIPLFDAHLGMMAWGRETGDQDYDLRLAESDLRTTIHRMMSVGPAAAKGVLLIGGDAIHMNDQTNVTPQSKHQLDVDGRFFKVVDTAIRVLAETVDLMLAKHSEVHVRVLRGNHDESAHLILTMALEQRYRDEPRVTVEKDPRDLFMMQWGRSAIFAHHGDKAKPQQLALYLSDICPFWSATRHRYALTGHIHHDSAKDLGPLRWESLRAFAPPDAYAASMGFGGRRALQSLTFHTENGMIMRIIDPIERIG